MSKFVLFTDSCCDLPAEVAEHYNITALPLGIVIGEESFANYLDGRELTSKDLYDRIRNGALPTTNAVSVGSYEEAMRTHLEAGEDILCINFSAALSTTYQSAVIAAQGLHEEFPERTIEVVDSCDAALGQGLLLLLCAQKMEQGATLQEVRDYALKTRLSIDHWFILDDLNHLKRGGRISAASAMVGSMLSIKPVLTVAADGTLKSVGKERGRKAALHALVKKVETLGSNLTENQIMVSHSDCLDDAMLVVNQLVETLNIPREHILINQFGAVIGSHIGPGAVAVLFQREGNR